MAGVVAAMAAMAATSVVVAVADAAGWNPNVAGAGMVLVSVGVAHGWRDWWRG